MLLKENLKKGDTVTYKKEIMFKGMIEVKSQIVAIMANKLLLLNGDIIYVV